VSAKGEGVVARQSRVRIIAPRPSMKLLSRLGLLLLPVLGACASAKEPARVELPLATAASGVVPVDTDLGYAVVLTEARALLRDFTFSVAGEAHVARFSLVPVARAHPGHIAGGAVTGEVRGRYVVDFLADGAEIALATLLVGDYSSMSFVFALASTDDVAGEDPLLGHTAILRGIASRDGSSVEFTFIVDSPEGRELTGAPFEKRVTAETTDAIGLRLLTYDPRGATTLFDGIDFFALDGDDDGLVTVGPESSSEAEVNAYNLARRTFQTHDHFDAIGIAGGP
jgi:hypothetical protein